MIPLTLAEAAGAQPSAHITARLLYREYRAGRLRAWKLGGTVCTSEGDVNDWISTCRDHSSRPASTSALADPPDGSSETGPERSGRDVALSTAKMLQNCGKPSRVISIPGSKPLLVFELPEE